MPRLEITHCPFMSNRDALLAINLFICENYQSRQSQGYQHERTLKLPSGITVLVKETPIDVNAPLTCDATFEITRLDVPEAAKAKYAQLQEQKHPNK